MLKLVYIGNQIDILNYLHLNFDLDFVFIENNARNIDVLQYCKDKNIKYVICKKSSDLAEYCQENDITIDLCFCCYLGIILKEDFIKKCNLIVNLHSGNLHTNRGGQPLYHNIINNDFFACLTAHTIDSKEIDAGKIISEINVPINYNLSFMMLVKYVYIFADSMIKYIIHNYYNNTIVFNNFDLQNSIYRPMVSKEISSIILNSKSLDEARKKLIDLNLC